jgi:hypothetical protein
VDQAAQNIIIVLVAAVVGWFALGNIYNIRHGHTIMRWLQGGLPKLGQKTKLQWRGTSVVQLEIAQARPPFKSAEVLLVFEPRDVPWLWLMTRAQRRHDMLIVRGWLNTSPPVDYDLYDPGSWSEQLTSGRGQTQNWHSEQLDGFNLRAPLSSKSASRDHAAAALSTARSISPTIWRLSARRADQHLELHIPLPNPRTVDAAQFFNAVRALAEQLGNR